METYKTTQKQLDAIVMETTTFDNDEVIPYYFNAIPSLPYFYPDDRLPNLKKHRQTCDKNRKKRKSKRK